MEPPASRLTRLLVGFILSLIAVISISILNEGGFSIADAMVAVSTLFAVLAGVLLAVIIAGGRRAHGSWITDSWISREPGDKMLSRIERERDEASMQDLGSKWAMMEMARLESKHGEE